MDANSKSIQGAGISAHLRRCGAEEETDERPVVAEPRCGPSKQRPRDRRHRQADGGRDASGARLVVHAAPVRGDPDPRGRRHRRTDGGRAGPRPALQTAGSEESIPRGASHWPKEGENVRVWVEGGGWRRWGEGVGDGEIGRVGEGNRAGLGLGILFAFRLVWPKYLLNILHFV